jgi:hypothetical protein
MNAQVLQNDTLSFWQPVILAGVSPILAPCYSPNVRKAREFFDFSSR